MCDVYGPIQSEYWMLIQNTNTAGPALFVDMTLSSHIHHTVKTGTKRLTPVTIIRFALPS